MRRTLPAALMVAVTLLSGCSSTPAADAALCEKQEEKGTLWYLRVDNGSDGATLEENFGLWPSSMWADGYRDSLADIRAYLSEERLASIEDKQLRTTARLLKNNVEAVQRAAEDDTQVDPDELEYLEVSLDQLAHICNRLT